MELEAAMLMKRAPISTVTIVGLQLLVLILGFAAKAHAMALLGN